MQQCRFRSVETGRFVSMAGMTDFNGASAFEMHSETFQLFYGGRPIGYGATGSLGVDAAEGVFYTGKTDFNLGCLQVGSGTALVDDGTGLSLRPFDGRSRAQHWERIVFVERTQGVLAFKCTTQSLESVQGRTGYDAWPVRAPILAKQLAATASDVMLLTHASPEMCKTLVDHVQTVTRTSDALQIVASDHNVAIVYSNAAFEFEKAQRWRDGPCCFVLLRHRGTGARVGFLCMSTSKDHRPPALLSTIQDDLSADAYVLGGCFDPVGVTDVSRHGWANLSGSAPTTYAGVARDFLFGKGVFALATRREPITEPMPNARQGSSHIPVTCDLGFADSRLMRLTASTTPASSSAKRQRLVLRDKEGATVTFEQLASDTTACALRYQILFCPRANFGARAPTLLMTRTDKELLERACAVRFDVASLAIVEPAWLEGSTFSPAGHEWCAVWTMPDALHRVLPLPSGVPAARVALALTIPHSGWSSAEPVPASLVRVLPDDAVPAVFAHYLEADANGARLACLPAGTADQTNARAAALNAMQVGTVAVAVEADAIVLVLTYLRQQDLECAMTPELTAMLLREYQLAERIASMAPAASLPADWVASYVALFAPSAAA